jgi:hypothetical protein
MNDAVVVKHDDDDDDVSVQCAVHTHILRLWMGIKSKLSVIIAPPPPAVLYNS